MEGYRVSCASQRVISLDPQLFLWPRLLRHRQHYRHYSNQSENSIRGLHVRRLLFQSDCNKVGTIRPILCKILKTKLHENPSGGSCSITCRQKTDIVRIRKAICFAETLHALSLVSTLRQTGC